ncbi:hypothetical protein RRG08_016789 [Elysia crispata]|uniref:Uncharacterized protein n=1 Tax=Elysia crispata TaxID=231223 RepID=A0AAE0ZZB6_9GAST|nr:hypothetical protein RRG08_016789 [Elysia crispata]
MLALAVVGAPLNITSTMDQVHTSYIRWISAPFTHPHAEKSSRLDLLSSAVCLLPRNVQFGRTIELSRHPRHRGDLWETGGSPSVCDPLI